MKSRYLQLSDVIMFEYTMLEENDADTGNVPVEFLVTTLKDNHKVIFSPISYEVEQDIIDGSVYYKKMPDPKSINTLNHLAVPKDKEDSMWYTFLDPDYKYVNEHNLYTPTMSDIKGSQYGENLMTDPAWGYYHYYHYNINGVRFDTMRLYFVNGYDFSNIFGFLSRITVECNTEGKFVDLCDFFFTKSTAYKLIKYLASPIIFGNNIYDRYIEIKLPCLWDLQAENQTNPTAASLIDYLDIKGGSNIMKLNFAYVLSEDKEIEDIEGSVADQITGNLPKNVNCTFTKSSSLKGVIPTDTINSDNLGCYIAECPDMPYFEFYGTWRDKPLNYKIVDRFNKGIILYDNSLIKRDSTYEVSEDYQVEYNIRKWVAMHELKCSFCVGDMVVKEETYNMSQVFVSDSDPFKFYYRPMIFDEDMGIFVNNINIVYTMRLINTEDKVQFVKVASLAVSDNTSRYYAKGTTLKTGDLTPFKVFNKIVENKHESTGNGYGTGNTKFVKVFYDSTSVVLDDNGVVQNGNYNYTLHMSQAPKAYKFTFKKMATDGKYTYMDLTNGYYKLMFRDSSGKVVTVDPTYSTNMNLYLGEIEFSVTSGIVSKLEEIEDSERKMSIVAYGDNNMMSSMFDFMFTI